MLFFFKGGDPPNYTLEEDLGFPFKGRTKPKDEGRGKTIPNTPNLLYSYWIPRSWIWKSTQPSLVPCTQRFLVLVGIFKGCLVGVSIYGSYRKESDFTIMAYFN